MLNFRHESEKVFEKNDLSKFKYFSDDFLMVTVLGKIQQNLFHAQRSLQKKPFCSTAIIPLSQKSHRVWDSVREKNFGSDRELFLSWSFSRRTSD